MIKTNTFEEYKARSFGKDINDMSGRNNRAYLTKYVSKRILSLLPRLQGNLVDIGCGDGTLLRMAYEENRFQNITGVLPTLEELNRLKSDLFRRNLNKKIILHKGEVEKINLKDKSFDIVVVNGVLLFLDNKECLKRALKEIKRISKSKGVIFLGEIPHFKEKIKELSFFRKIIFNLNLLKELGLRNFIKRCLSKFFAKIGKKNVQVRREEDILILTEKEFEKIVKEEGLIIKQKINHKEINSSGKEIENKTRYDYILMLENV